jgi:hypothetical protein
MLNDDPLARQSIAAELGRVADDTVKEHIAGITQEPLLTARIGQALEHWSTDRIISGRHVRIITQDIPDRGRRALERDIGADVYVGIEVREKNKRESKGFLVQAKLRRNLRDSAGHRDLWRECRGMLDRTASSYVWLYDRNGIGVLNAQQVRYPPGDRFEDLPTRTATTLFDGTLRCHEGAQELGLPAIEGGPARMRSEVVRCS